MGEDWQECSWRLAFSKESVSFSGDREETVIIRSMKKTKKRIYSYQESIIGLKAVILCIL